MKLNLARIEMQTRISEWRQRLIALPFISAVFLASQGSAFACILQLQQRDGGRGFCDLGVDGIWWRWSAWVFSAADLLVPSRIRLVSDHGEAERGISRVYGCKLIHMPDDYVVILVLPCS